MECWSLYARVFCGVKIERRWLSDGGGRDETICNGPDFVAVANVKCDLENIATFRVCVECTNNIIGMRPLVFPWWIANKKKEQNIL